MRRIGSVLLFILFIGCILGQSGVNPEDTKTIKPTILIKGGTVVNFNAEEKADVLIVDGKISKVGKNLVAPDASRVIDATGKYVMPGGIDPHVHMEFMGTVSKDDFYTGTAAALAGGTTLIIDFAIALKNQSLIEVYETYRKKAEKAAGHYAFHMGISEFNERVAKEMEILVKEKQVVNSFKAFMAYKNVFQISDEDFLEALKKARELGAVMMVHAENGDLVASGQKKLLEMGITGPEGHPQSRPAYVEAEAVRRAISLARHAGAPLYIVHVMSKEAMEEIVKAKMKGDRVVGEPILSGLVLDDSGYYNKDWDEAAKWVMSPPIRGKEDQKALKNALKNRLLDLVGTDHCVFSMEQKRMGRDDFTKIPNGVHGVEDRMGLVWDRMVHTGMIKPQDFVRITSTEAAQIFNIYPQKGAILEGSDADVIILNPKATKIISAKTHHQNIEYSLFEGWKQNGVVEITILDGVIVWENNKLNVVKGQGKFVKTPPFGKLFDGLEKEQETLLPIKVDRK